MRNVQRSAPSVVIALAVLCGACTYTYQERQKQIEPMLSAAGFKLKLADTPEKLAKLQAMPQRKFQTLTRRGKTYYAYTDVEGCRCAYLGNRSAYESYQSLLQQQQMVEQDREEATVNEDTAIVENDAMWESWGFDVW